MSWADAGKFLAGLMVGILILFWKSYWGKRGEKAGEIDAIDKKLDQVLAQLQKTTELTEGIKADFSDRNSSKQRLREMRKEVSFKLSDTLADLEDIAGQAMDHAYVYAAALGGMVHDEYHKKRDKISSHYTTSLRTMIQLWGHVGLVFDDPARDLAQKVYNAAYGVLAKTNRFQYETKNAVEMMELFRSRSKELRELIREQLLA